MLAPGGPEKPHARQLVEDAFPEAEEQLPETVAVDSLPSCLTIGSNASGIDEHTGVLQQASEHAV